jgi:hypothetical protein
MISIRKFVVGAGMAVGMFALSASAAPVQAREASSTPVTVTYQVQFTPSKACTDAINAVKVAVANDRSEDVAERNIARTVGADATDVSEDSTERAGFVTVFKTARAACFTTSTTTTSAPKAFTFTPSASCTAAVQALKAAWAQHASWSQLQTLAQAARTACGWRWGRTPS